MQAPVNIAMDLRVNSDKAATWNALKNTVSIRIYNIVRI